MTEDEKEYINKCTFAIKTLSEAWISMDDRFSEAFKHLSLALMEMNKDINSLADIMRVINYRDKERRDANNTTQ